MKVIEPIIICRNLFSENKTIMAAKNGIVAITKPILGKMISEYTKKDLSHILTVINDASLKYKGVIPDSCWKEPYMQEKELLNESFLRELCNFFIVISSKLAL